MGDVDGLEGVKSVRQPTPDAKGAMPPSRIAVGQDGEGGVRGDASRRRERGGRGGQATESRDET